MNFVLAVCQLSINMVWCVVVHTVTLFNKSTLKCVLLSVKKTHGISNHKPGVSGVYEVSVSRFILQWLHQQKKKKKKKKQYDRIDQLFCQIVVSLGPRQTKWNMTINDKQ